MEGIKVFYIYYIYETVLGMHLGWESASEMITDFQDPFVLQIAGYNEAITLYMFYIFCTIHVDSDPVALPLTLRSPPRKRKINAGTVSIFRCI